MTGHSELTPIASEDAIAAKYEKAFDKVYDELDAFATILGGRAWTNDKIFEVEASRTLKLPTTKWNCR